MKLNIKESWNEITLEDYFMYESINKDDSIDPMVKKIKILSLLTGAHEDHFKQWTITEINLFFESFDFLNEEPIGDIQPYYIIGGKEYKLITNLKDLKGSQFIDLNDLIKDPEMILDNLDKICATLLLPTVKLSPKKRLINRLNKITNSLRKPSKTGSNSLIQPILPNTEKYLETPLEETAENIFKNMNVTQCMGICVFFFNYAMILTECSADYLMLTKNPQFQSALNQLKNQQETMNHPMMKVIEKNLEQLKDLDSIMVG